MTTQRPPSQAIRARTKKKSSPSKEKRAKIQTAKKVANKKAHAKKKSSIKGNSTPGTKKAAKRVAQPVRRKPEAPDMSMYVRRTKDLTDVQVAEAKLTVIRVISMKGNVREATDAAGVDRSLAYVWRTKDEPFREAWDDAMEEAVDRWEEEARRRSVDGYDHPVIYQGEITDTYKMYSDGLLRDMLRGHRPERFKERTEHSTPPGQPLALDVETKSDVISTIMSMITSKRDPA